MQVISWEEFAGQGAGEERAAPVPLALTVGVFDGVHRGHRALIRRVCEEGGCAPAVVTFRQNPMAAIAPERHAGDIFSLERKLSSLKELGVRLAVLIDFSPEFSKISGRDFVDLLLGSRPVGLVALGEDFRCGRGMDVGAKEIQAIAASRGVAAWIAPPVMDAGLPVSSSRIRQALAAGRVAEAGRLLGGARGSDVAREIVPNWRS